MIIHIYFLPDQVTAPFFLLGFTDCLLIISERVVACAVATLLSYRSSWLLIVASYPINVTFTFLPSPIPKNTLFFILRLQAQSWLGLPVIIIHLMKELWRQHCSSSLAQYCWTKRSPAVQDSPPFLLSALVRVWMLHQSCCGWSSKMTS